MHCHLFSGESSMDQSSFPLKFVTCTRRKSIFLQINTHTHSSSKVFLHQCTLVTSLYFLLISLSFFTTPLRILAVRLNLFNHVLILFYTNFACILAIRYHVFRWELCKDCVWENVKKTQVVCIQRSLAIGSCEWLATSKSPKCHTCEVCRKLKGHDSWSTTGHKV